MKRNDIKLEELQDWISKEEIVFARSARECKRLVSTLNGTLKVIVNGEVVWQGIQPFLAVEEYNKVTQKFINPLKDFKI